MNKREISKGIVTILFVLLAGFQFAKAADFQPDRYKYQIEYSGIGQNGYTLVDVTIMCKSVDEAYDTASRMAVHGVLFMKDAPHVNIPAQTEIVSDETLNDKQENFFKTFFGEGQYKKYVKDVGTSKMQIAKAPKGKNYIIKVTVSVDRRNLRLDLESQNIIKSLDKILKQ